jgi:hypothetical protein
MRTTRTNPNEVERVEPLDPLKNLPAPRREIVPAPTPAPEAVPA